MVMDGNDTHKAETMGVRGHHNDITNLMLWGCFTQRKQNTAFIGGGDIHGSCTDQQEMCMEVCTSIMYYNCVSRIDIINILQSIQTLQEDTEMFTPLPSRKLV